MCCSRAARRSRRTGYPSRRAAPSLPYSNRCDGRRCLEEVRWHMVCRAYLRVRQPGPAFAWAMMPDQWLQQPSGLVTAPWQSQSAHSALHDMAVHNRQAVALLNALPLLRRSLTCSPRHTDPQTPCSLQNCFKTRRRQRKKRTRCSSRRPTPQQLLRRCVGANHKASRLGGTAAIWCWEPVFLSRPTSRIQGCLTTASHDRSQSRDDRQNRVSAFRVRSET